MKRLFTWCSFLLVSGSTLAVNDPYDAIIAHQDKGQYQQALTQINSLLKHNQQDVQALLLQGNVHKLMGNSDQATRIFKQLINSHPQMPEPYNNLAVLYADKGQTALAIETLQQAFATSDSYATAYKNLRTLYNEMASSAYRDALEIDKPKRKKDSIFALLSRTQTAEANGQVDPSTNDNVASITDNALTQSTGPAAKTSSTFNEVTEQNLVRQTVDGWSSAWAKQQTSAYFGSYHPKFIPPKGMSRKGWESYRGKRLTRPKNIQLQIVGLVVEIRNENIATAIFEQHYRSDTYADTVVKKLTLAKHNGKWLIQQEVSL